MSVCMVCFGPCPVDAVTCGPSCCRARYRARVRRTSMAPRVPVPRVSDALRDVREAVARLLERGRVARDATCNGDTT